jgi:hypothetical protein
LYRVADVEKWLTERTHPHIAAERARSTVR